MEVTSAIFIKQLIFYKFNKFTKKKKSYAYNSLKKNYSFNHTNIFF